MRKKLFKTKGLPKLLKINAIRKEICYNLLIVLDGR